MEKRDGRVEQQRKRFSHHHYFLSGIHRQYGVALSLPPGRA
jgi:hypothetical protein